MSDPVAPEPPAPTAQSASPNDSARKRRGPPVWGVVAFFALLAAMLVINQFASTGGPPIQWIENDFLTAAAQASKSKADMFLYLYDPADPDTARNEREVFSQRWARDPLAGVVCCRVAVPGNAPLAAKYAYKKAPLFLVVDPAGTPVSRAEGAVSELQFRTNIAEPLHRDRAKPGAGERP